MIVKLKEGLKLKPKSLKLGVEYLAARDGNFHYRVYPSSAVAPEIYAQDFFDVVDDSDEQTLILKRESDFPFGQSPEGMAKKDNRKDRKSPYKYLSKPFQDAVADAHLAGEFKYGAWNYLKGHSAMDLLEAMERHIAEVKMGIDQDKDCSDRIGRAVHHLGCVGANINMYLTQLTIGTLIDDRPKEFKRATD